MTLKLILLVVVMFAGAEGMGWIEVLPEVDTLWKWLDAECAPEAVCAMLWQMGALYDTKARAYRPPFFVAHMDVALRSIREAVNNPQHELCRHASDFMVHHLGTFDDETGEVVSVARPFNHGCIAVMKLPELVQHHELAAKEALREKFDKESA